jgi:hypothetical protein
MKFRTRIPTIIAWVIMATGASAGAATPENGRSTGKTVAPPGTTQFIAKASVQTLVLKGGALFPAGSVPLNSTISLNGPTSQCGLFFTVVTANEGPGAINTELFRQSFGSAFGANPVVNYNAGVVTIAIGGKFRAVVSAMPGSDNQCMGQASADFEVKPPAAPTPSFGSMVTKIVNVTDNNMLWIVNVNGSGNATCNYHLRTLSLPDGTPLSDNPMQYVPGNIDIGKGSLTVQKPAPGHGVRFEVYQSDSDKVGNKGCLGQPSLDLNVAAPQKLSVVVALPKPPVPGKIIDLTLPGQSFALGQPVYAMLSATGDSCGYTIKAHPLPFIEIHNDIPLASKTYGKTQISWNLNNLGQALTPGKWTVFIQSALPGELAPGEVSCLIPPAGKGQVFFEIQP